ncbi:glycosyltransferase family 4 protein [Maribacter sp. 2308TA10-17]|uniref:glycosyltransferase family 4 protein n=1 Tax=Maribacter sp. 2308TA10-17 TaxID=3386276 RepID=UPI0039BD6C4A
MTPKPEYAYIAFDVFPSQKGAATHIDHCLKALQNTFATGILICLGTEEMPSFQYDSERKLYVYRFKEKIRNFLERTQQFQNTVTKLLQLPLAEYVKLVHFRDVWGGVASLNTNVKFHTVFEVNAFSHLELPNRYSNSSPAALAKIKKLEKRCLLDSTAIITPSPITKSFMVKTFDTNPKKITVIPNGVSIFKTKKNTPKSRYILYFGAFQKWQGIKTLFKAFKELNDLDLRLMLCSSVPQKRIEVYQDLARDIGIFERIDWFFELNKKELAQKIKDAFLTVAPLTACNRNIVQGCNPLKVLESMSYGTPVVASKLPVIEHLIEDGETGFLVPPDRPQLLGRRIRTLMEREKLVGQVGSKAKKSIEEKYLWEDQELKMKNLYLNLEYV